jgi:sugar lactone lactonase YvrE
VKGWCVAAATALVAAACGASGTDREITFVDGRIFPESMTSTASGDLYFSSLGQNAVYRAAANTTQAVQWIPPKANGLNFVLGVLADEPDGVLWVCSSANGGRNGAPYVGETALKAFNLKDASFKASYPFPGNGLCNDIAVAADGTVYATDTNEARVLRLKKGAEALDVWAADSMLLRSADGIALKDGAVYVNTYSQGTLVRIPVNADSSAGTITKLDTSRGLVHPDGMRTIDKETMLLVEGEGRLDEVTIAGNTANIKVLRSRLKDPTAVALAGGTAWVTEARIGLLDSSKDPGPFRAVGVAYPEH